MQHHNPPFQGGRAAHTLFSALQSNVYLLLLSRLRRFAFAVLDCMLKNNPVMLDSITSIQEQKRI